MRFLMLLLTSTLSVWDSPLLRGLPRCPVCGVPLFYSVERLLGRCRGCRDSA